MLKLPQLNLCTFEIEQSDSASSALAQIERRMDFYLALLSKSSICGRAEQSPGYGLLFMPRQGRRQDSNRSVFQSSLYVTMELG